MGSSNLPRVLGEAEHQPRGQDRPLGYTFGSITPLTTHQVTVSPSRAATGLYVTCLGRRAHTHTTHFSLVLWCDWATASHTWQLRGVVGVEGGYGMGELRGL